jgi:hypothetical protein
MQSIWLSRVGFEREPWYNNPDKEKFLVNFKLKKIQPNKNIFTFLKEYRFSWTPHWQRTVPLLVSGALKTEMRNYGIESAEEGLLLPLIRKVNKTLLPKGRS